MVRSVNHKRWHHLGNLRVLIATDPQQASSWQPTVTALESKLEKVNLSPPPALVKEWENRCQRLTTSKKKAGKEETKKEIAVLQELIKTPRDSIRKPPTLVSTPSTPSASSGSSTTSTTSSSSSGSSGARISSNTGSSSATTPSSGIHPRQTRNLPHRSSTVLGEREAPPHVTTTARSEHTTTNDRHSTLRTAIHRSPRPDPAPRSATHNALHHDVNTPDNLDTQRHTFLSRSNAMPISIGHGSKQGMVLVYPDDLELEPSLERKPFGWRGSGWARVLQDGMDQEVFVDVVVSIPRGARGYAPEGASASGSRGSVGTESGSGVRPYGSNGEGPRWEDSANGGDRHTPNHGNDGGNDEGEYKETGGKRKRGDDGGAVKRARYA